MNLDETLKKVRSLEGVIYIGTIPEQQPMIPQGERLLAVQSQYIKARVMDVSRPDWYAQAYEDYHNGMAPQTSLLRVRESSLQEAIETFGENQRISFLFPDIAVHRPELN